MALQGATSANLIDTAHLPGPFASASGCSIGIGDGPLGVNTIHTNLNGSFFLDNVNLPHSGGMVLGFGIIPNLPGIIAKLSPSLNACSLQINLDGTVSFISGSNYIITKPLIKLASRSYIELFIQKLGNNPAAVSISINGMRAAVGLMTGPSVLPDPLTEIEMGITGNAKFDSVYHFDTTGIANNAPIGAKIVGLWAAASSGQYSEWDHPDTPTDWQAVANYPPYELPLDTIFAATASSGVMAVGVQSPLNWVIIDGVVVAARAKGSADGTLGIGVGNGVTLDIADDVAVTSGSNNYRVPVSINPFTGLPWSTGAMATLQPYLRNDTTYPPPLVGSFLLGDIAQIYVYNATARFQVDTGTGATFVAGDTTGSSAFIQLNDAGSVLHFQDASSGSFSGSFDLEVYHASTVLVKDTSSLSMSGSFPYMEVGHSVAGNLTLQNGASLSVTNGASFVTHGAPLTLDSVSFVLSGSNDSVTSPNGAVFGYFGFAQGSGHTMNFTDQSYSDGSQGAVTSWAWDFGDSFTSPLQNPVHVYAGSGTFTVTLVVTTSGGKTSTVTRSVTVA